MAPLASAGPRPATATSRPMPVSQMTGGAQISTSPAAPGPAGQIPAPNSAMASASVAAAASPTASPARPASTRR
jgi:hypothetical protein